MKQLLISVLIVVVVAAHAAGDESKIVTSPTEPFRVGERVLPLLQKHCFSCHNADEQNGEVRLDNLESLKLDARLDLLNRAYEQIFIGEMPLKSEKQPTEAERNLLTDWVSSELRAHNASKLEDKLRKPEYGNVVDHEKLFSGQYKDLPGFTPDRRWLISEFIFDAKLNHLLGVKKTKVRDGKNQPIIGEILITGLTNVVTYTIDELSTPMRGLPGNEGDNVNIHGIGHNGSFSGVPADKIRENIRILHMKQVARIVKRLKAEPEGKGTMFDNTMIMYFPEGGETHHGSGSEAPFVILAGDKCKLDMAGRYIRLPYHGNEGHKTIGNWYTALLNFNGNPIKHYGDFDLEMARKKLDQAGAIKQFMT